MDDMNEDRSVSSGHEEVSHRPKLSAQGKWADVMFDLKHFMGVPRRTQLSLNIWWQQKLAQLAFYAVKYPVFVVLFCVLVTLIAGAGLPLLRMETDMDLLWVPNDVPAWEDERWVQSEFGMRTQRVATLYVLKEGSTSLAAGALTKSSLLEVFDIHDYLSTGTNYQDVCQRNGAYAECSIHSLFSIWGNSKTTLEGRTQSEILSDITGNYTAISWSLGGVVTNENAEVTYAEALRMTYDVSGEESAESGYVTLQKSVETYMDSVSLTDLNSYYLHGNSIPNEISRTTDQDMQLVVVSLILALVYMTISISRISWVQTKVVLGATSVVTVLCSLIIAGGVGGFLGMDYNPIVPLVIFILAGIGIDFQSTPTNVRLADRIEATMIHAGNAITLTSLTDFGVFAAGFLFSPFEGVVQFSFFAAFAILALFFLQLTFFMSCLVWDAKRVAAGRPEFFPFVKCGGARRNSESDSNTRPQDVTGVEVEEVNTTVEEKATDAPKPTAFVVRAARSCTRVAKRCFRCVKSLYNPDPQEGPFRFFIRRYYSKLATHRFVVPFIVLVFFIMAGVGLFLLIAYTPSVGAPVQDMMGPNSPPTKYLDNTEKYFSNVVVLDIAIKGAADGTPLDYTTSDVQDALVKLADDYEALPQTIKPLSSWWNDFITYNGGTAPAATDFYPTLYNFLKDDTYKKYSADIVLRRGVIVASRFTVRMTFSHDKATTTDDRTNDMNTVLDLAKSNTVMEIIANSFNFKLLQRDARMLQDTIMNIGLATLVVWIALLMFLHPYIAFLTVVTVVLIDIDLFGIVMVALDVPIDTVTYVSLSIAVTLSVDYAAHLGVSFYHAQGNSLRGRARHAINEIGTSVFAGGFSTFLGVLVLAFAQSGAFRTFFSMMFGITVLGLLHGLIFFPAFLGLVGFKAQYPAEVVPDEAEVEAVTIGDIENMKSKSVEDSTGGRNDDETPQVLV